MKKKNDPSFEEYLSLIEQFKSECRDARIFSEVKRHGKKSLFKSGEESQIRASLDELLEEKHLLPLGEKWREIPENVDSGGWFHWKCWTDPGPGYWIWPPEKADRLEIAFRSLFSEDARSFDNDVCFAGGGVRFNPCVPPGSWSLDKCLAIIDQKKIGLIAMIEDGGEWSRDQDVKDWWSKRTSSRG